MRQAARELKALGIEAVAIRVLFSDFNPAHELRAKAIVEEEIPGIFVTTFSFISPQLREFEHFTTAACIGPKVNATSRTSKTICARSAWWGTAPHGLQRRRGDGMDGHRKARADPAIGSRGGRAGSGWVGRLAGRETLITFDIGGTSGDIGIISGGRYAETDARSTSIAGCPRRTSIPSARVAA